MITAARAFLFLGVYLILAGIAGYLSNPEGAKTALLSGGGFGALCLVWGILLACGFAWAKWPGLATMALLCAAFVWRSIVGWLAVAGGESEKLFAAALITSMLIVTLLAANFVLRDRKARP